MTIETLRIVVDVRVDGDEISGHAGDGTGEPKPFLGWLGLIGALDTLIDLARPQDTEPVVRVCVAFATADDAHAFAASPRLHDAILDAGVQSAPELWFTHAQAEQGPR